MIFITRQKLFMQVMACDVWYTRLSPCKLFNACLCRCFSLTQFCLDEFCFISLDFCNTLLWLCMWHILVKTVWKSWHWCLGISIDTAKFYVFLTKLRGRKQKHFWLIQILCSFIWHQWHVPSIISPGVSIGGLVKRFEFLEHSSIYILKK